MAKCKVHFINVFSFSRDFISLNLSWIVFFFLSSRIYKFSFYIPSSQFNITYWHKTDSNYNLHFRDQEKYLVILSLYRNLRWFQVWKRNCYVMYFVFNNFFYASLSILPLKNSSKYNNSIFIQALPSIKTFLLLDF